MISKETATDIALTYRNIEVAQKLLEEIEKSINHNQIPDIRDVFGRSQGGLQLGVPSGETSQRLFNVSWNLAKPILEAQIANYQAELTVLNQKAEQELTKGEITWPQLKT